ncbi:MAG: type II/IV secretion system protein [Phycisphaeraceae bacterium]|nr:type II/IV secretion system protein [Phycisphaeraceae bacterium]
MSTIEAKPTALSLDVPKVEARAPSPALPTAHFLNAIPHDFARRHLVLSSGLDGAFERLRIAEQTKPWIIHNVGVALGRPVVTEVHPAESIAAAIDAAYANRESQPDNAHIPVDVTGDLDRALKDAESDLLNTQGKAPSVKLVDLILFEALLKGASDVHLQPLRGRTLVRYRLDGVLHTMRELPPALAACVTSRVKVMARLDVAEQRAPQDGRATVSIGTSGTGARRIDLRVSSLPSTYGERIVLRLLDPSRSPHLKSFAALGMPESIEQRYLTQANRTSGIVLSTGPTGSGKTTTLYATLAWLSTTHSGTRGGMGGCELNMMTIEDPVEYDLSSGSGREEPGGAGVPPAAAPGAGLSISQTQVDPRKNVTFAAGLRHILRQDPDVIMVGEVRDQETAKIAVQASLTGHLVLSTLHTSDAASAVARLIDLSVEPFLVASSLSAVLAQRLVRTVHRECNGSGCELCMGSGYKGRTGVFELLVMDATLRDLICRRASAIEIKEQAQKAGMVTLREAGEDLIRRGLTTAAEVSRVIEAVEDEI